MTNENISYVTAAELRAAIEKHPPMTIFDDALDNKDARRDPEVAKRLNEWRAREERLREEERRMLAGLLDGTVKVRMWALSEPQDLVGHWVDENRRIKSLLIEVTKDQVQVACTFEDNSSDVFDGDYINVLDDEYVLARKGLGK